MISSVCNTIFQRSIADYHLTDNIDAAIKDPYAKGTIEYILYHKNWIDTVQWHLEDIVRDPLIDAAAGMIIKRRIDSSNQERTDMVEQIDDYFLDKYKAIVPKKEAGLNTESPAWAIDRLSILALKIYHMQAEVDRTDASAEHLAKCKVKLAILLEQRTDLSTSIDTLLEDISQGNTIMKVYRQMKMYNDPALNPVLYQQQT